MRDFFPALKAWRGFSDMTGFLRGGGRRARSRPIPHLFPGALGTAPRLPAAAGAPRGAADPAPPAPLAAAAAGCEAAPAAPRGTGAPPQRRAHTTHTHTHPRISVCVPRNRTPSAPGPSVTRR